MRRHRLLRVLGLVVVLATGHVVAQTTTVLTPEEQREFLLKAKVTGSRPAGKGITGTMRLTLSDGMVTHDASFQSIEERASAEDIQRGRRRAGERFFADSYKYNLAAYELARLLGLDDMMPVTVERRWNGKIGSLAWWVDDVLMDEAEREKQNAQPPDSLAFLRQRQRMFVFSELLRDTDRNKGNVLYTKDWRVIMIDFTRAFRLDAEIRTPAVLQQCERRLLTALQQLTEADVRRVTSNYLTGREIAGVMARRQLIVARYDQLILERGENRVLY